VQGILPLLAQTPGLTPASQLRHYPSRQQLQETIAAHRINLCLLDVSTSPHDALKCLAELLRLDSSMQVVAVLTNDDSAQILRSLRQGATEFLASPFTVEQIEAALGRITRLNPLSTRKRAKVYCVMPAKGGCGATTVACSLAWHWKRLGTKRILLADLDPLAGTMSFLLKIKGQFSFVDVLQRQGEIDADLWKGMITHHNGVDVLLSPENPGEAQSVLTDATSIIEYARLTYDVVILDSNGVYGTWNLSQAELADEVLLITTNELPAVQAAQRSLAYLESNQIGRWKTRVLVNRYDREGGVEQEVIGTALDTDLYHIIPADYETIQKALMEGKVIPANSTFGKSLTTLGNRLAGREEKEGKPASIASSLLSLFSRSSS
jgi:pilus assembly protein CpaE